MNNFLSDLEVRYVDGKRWEVMETFTYRIGSPKGKEFVAVPRGFITDFASMPLNIIFRSPGGKWDKPAVIHDAVYARGYVEQDGGTIRDVTRKEADQMFNEAMKVAGVGWQRWFIYRGVRLGGWRPWNRYRKQEGADVDLEKAG